MRRGYFCCGSGGGQAVVTKIAFLSHSRTHSGRFVLLFVGRQAVRGLKKKCGRRAKVPFFFVTFALRKSARMRGARPARQPGRPAAPRRVSTNFDAVWMMTRTRIVAVSYLNTIPYIYGITRAGGSLREGLLLCPPRLCAEALRTGEANVGLIPVAAIPEIPDLQIITPLLHRRQRPGAYRRASRPTIPLRSSTRSGSTAIRAHRCGWPASSRPKSGGIAPQWRPLTDYSFGTGAAAGTHGTIPAAEATGTLGH